MDEDAVTLTCYLRERTRAGARSAGAALVDRCGRRSVAASVLLRGIEGYGPRQPARAGRALPIPADPPLTAVAVDTSARIHPLLEEMSGIAQPRLITLEYGRLLSGEIAPVRLAESFVEATRLTLYCGQADRVLKAPAFEAACELLYRRGVAGATVLPGIDGTVGGQRRRARFLRPGADVPLMLIAVGSGDRIAVTLPELAGLFRHPLMTVANVRLCKRDGQVISRPDPPPGNAVTGRPGMVPQVKLTVYTSEAARIHGAPVHRAIVARLRSSGVSSAASHRGSWGFHGQRAPHGDHFALHGRHVPVVTTVIDQAERIGSAFDVIDALTPGRGLVTAETVLTPQSAVACSDQEGRLR